MNPSISTNDFVIRFANVNGTGSASANTLFAKTIFRMGIPVTPKNIFPSNIQGLPTWYEVRVSEKGYLGRRAGVDIMVAVNPQSHTQDTASVLPGGCFIYDSSKPLPETGRRTDIRYMGIPMTLLCMEHFSDPRKVQLLKNIVYVGALAQLLCMDMEVLRESVRLQFKGKDKLIESNFTAIELGANYARDHFKEPLAFCLKAADQVKDKIIVDGNTACALGALYAGATVAAWYPITPSTSIMGAFEKYANKHRKDPETGLNRFAIVQAEDELASIGMVIGAAWNGARAFTSTSGPGVSLMSEFIGLAYFAEIPVVLINVQRGGPSTGMPTRTQQSDILSSAYASHGDTRHVLLFPNTPKECFEHTADAFDLAERLQTPVFVMTDLDLGMNDHMSEPFEWDDSRVYDRGKVLSAEELDQMADWGRYLDVDGDGIGFRTIPGTHPTKGSYFTRGTSHDEYARYTESGDAYIRNVDRLMVKWDTAKSLVPKPEFYQETNQSEVGIIFFGTSSYSALEACDLLAADGLPVDAMRLRACPFNQDVQDFIDAHKSILIIEQNRDAQMRSLLTNEACTLIRRN
ncbi:MAG: 2-oxoacid:acceptor oxidoreductase subunit alpha [Saprospiraceae bacterium]